LFDAGVDGGADTTKSQTIENMWATFVSVKIADGSQLEFRIYISHRPGRELCSEAI
jgi:hypothetical protein